MQNKPGTNNKDKVKNIFRSIGAVLAALVVGAVLSIGTDFLLEKAGIFPSFQEQQLHGFHTWWLLLLALVYRAVYTVLSGFIAAVLAPYHPIEHAMIPGIIGFAVSLAGTIIMWDKGSQWYSISLTVLTPYCAWLGGKLKRN